MHKIKEKLMEELYEYEDKMKKSNGKLAAGDLETIQKLSSTIKNLDKIEMMEDGKGYSEDTDFMGEGRMYGVSYARGRGRNARRDSMGRYSREGGSSYARGGQGNGSSQAGYSYDGAKGYMMEQLEEMMESAENTQQRRVIEECMMELERI